MLVLEEETRIKIFCFCFLPFHPHCQVSNTQLVISNSDALSPHATTLLHSDNKQLSTLPQLHKKTNDTIIKNLHKPYIDNILAKNSKTLSMNEPFCVQCSVVNVFRNQIDYDQENCQDAYSLVNDSFNGECFHETLHLYQDQPTLQ